MEQILVMINDSPRVRLADDSWIAEHAVSLGALDDEDAFEFIERHYESDGHFYAIDSAKDAEIFANTYTGRFAEFVMTEVLLLRDSWLLEEV